MSIELVTPDLTTPEGAKKALADVHAAAKSLQQEKAALQTKIGELTADLKAVQLALTEQQRATALAGEGGHETELKAFIRPDGKIRAVGEMDDQVGWVDGLLDSEPVCAWQRQLQETVETRNIIRRLKSWRDPEARRHAAPKCDAKIRRLMEQAPASIKRAFGDISTSGAEWYPDVMMPVLEREFVLQRRLASLFQTMPMSAKNMLLPFLTTGLRPYLKASVSADDPSYYTSSSVVTAQRSIDAVGFAVRTQLDEEASEDSLIDSMGLLRQELITAIVDGEEDAIINGDTASTHQDTIASWNIRSRWGSTGLGTASDHRRAWIGLRPRATDVSNTADGSGAETTAGFLTARGSLDSPHGVSGELICVVSPEYYIVKMLGFSEVLTMEKYGPLATVLSGQLASLLGVPIIVSEFVGADLNASGVFDNVTTNKTGFIICNRSRFKIGQRRGSMVEIDKDIPRGIYNMVSTVREVFFTVDSSSKKNVRWNYKHSIS